MRAGRVAAAALVAAALVAIPTVPAAADPVRDAQYWLDEYGIRTAWTVTQGAGVTDDRDHRHGRGRHGAGAARRGDRRHGLLRPRLGERADPVGSSGSEHGTLVASLAAGRGTGVNTGVIGAAPAANILSISVGFGEGDVDPDEQIAAAVRWAVDHGADVINMSLTRNTLAWPESWDQAFLYAQQSDVVVVAAAGNRGSGTTVVGAPATMPGVLTVAGVDRSGQASFDASSQGITLGVSAPSGARRRRPGRSRDALGQHQRGDPIVCRRHRRARAGRASSSTPRTS